ncbi:hypothetical protein [Streptomyces chrestomyceticus]|uniref:hypothetical protein n=1 Tax=Streptomyces chrestomyceticus TaxID=68185 RepID=UPI0037985127
MRDGDLVSIDCDANVDGWAGDVAGQLHRQPPKPGEPEGPEADEHHPAGLGGRHRHGCRRRSYRGQRTRGRPRSNRCS